MGQRRENKQEDDANHSLPLEDVTQDHLHKDIPERAGEEDEASTQTDDFEN